MNDVKSETASSYSGWQLLKDMLEAGKAQAAQVIEATKECDHKGHYRLAGGAYIAIRMCINCGKSWRMWTKPEYGDYPIAEWEEVKEPVTVPELVIGNYDEARIYTELDDDEE
jgi:hypothetical protein